MANCSDKKIVELANYSWTLEKPGLHGNLENPPSRPRELNTTLFLEEDEEEEEEEEEEEDWDLMAVKGRSYDPQKKCEKTNVLRRLQGATPSER